VSRSGDPEVAIVGGGVIGLTCAWRCAEAGLPTVLIDPAPASGASWAAAGMLAPVTELHYGEESLLRLNLAAAADFPDFVTELERSSGSKIGYRRTGTLSVALDAGDREVLRDLHEFQRSLGLEVELLTGSQCRQLEPYLDPGVHYGLSVPGDHQVDNRALLAALEVAAHRAGVIRIAAETVAVEVMGGQAAGVRLAVSREVGDREVGGRVNGQAGGREADGREFEAGGREIGREIKAQIVVLAAGHQSGAPGGWPVALPIRPVKGQILRLRVPETHRPFLQRTIRGTVRGFPIYLVPRTGGELVVGATTEEAGPDRRVTAGGVYELLRDAHALLPGIGELELIETTARLRPGSPDNAPLVGKTGIAGLLAATGHYRNGILLAPLTAAAIVSVIRSGQVPAEFAPFSPRRFEPGFAAGQSLSEPGSLGGARK
jgi:glycine oxidase